MAKAPTIADLQSSARMLLDEITAKGITASDKSHIVESAKKLLAIVDQTIPHINQAQAAFGGQEQSLAQATQLKNTLNKVIATYSGA